MRFNILYNETRIFEVDERSESICHSPSTPTTIFSPHIVCLEITTPRRGDRVRLGKGPQNRAA